MSKNLAAGSGAYAVQMNLPAEPVVIDVSGCCVKSEGLESPIDAFYENVGDALRLGTPDNLSGSPALGRLLALGIVTGAEAYFRSIFLELIRLCPLTRDRVSDQMVALGAIDYYGIDRVGMGLFEGVSFASEAEVKKKSQNILSFTWSPNSSLGVALATYDAVCHIRHASVHSHGILNRGNAKSLGMEGAGSVQLVLDFPILQKVALACTSAIRAYNSELYNSVLEKWVSQKVLVGVWGQDKEVMNRLFDLFRSRRDKVSPANAYRAHQALVPVIRGRLTRGSN